MKKDNIPNNFNHADNIVSILHQVKRNGYLQQVKQMWKNNLPNSFDSDFRRKTIQHYKRKVKKPFYLAQQPQYQTEMRFNSHFNAFVKSIQQFQKIKQQPIYQLPALTDLQKEGHSQALIYNAQRKCDVSPQNIKKRRIQKQQKYFQSQTSNYFPTKINFTQNLTEMARRNQNQSRINIVFESRINQRHNSLQYQVNLKTRQFTTKSKNTVKQQKNKYYKILNSRRSHLTISKTNTTENQSSQDIYINTQIALENLNKLIGCQHKLKNFRISKQKLHQILQKRYGQQIITTFFNLQSIQDFPGIMKVIKQIIISQPKMAQMLTFLTFDINQDGVITQDQLMAINNLINSESPITQDINRIIVYAKQNLNINFSSDLPIQFIKYPTLRQYMKINDQNRQPDAGSVRGIYRLFSFKMQNNEIQARNKTLPIIKQKQIDLTKRKIKINFEHFQKCFQKVGHPQFILDLVTFLIGKQYNKIDKQSPRKLSHLKKVRRGTFSIEPRQKISLSQHSSFNQTSKAQQLLQKMHRQNKNLATIHYT